MAVYYLKNSTGSEIEINDLGLVIADGQSITIDQNDFDGYLTENLITALNDSPAAGLILSTTDIGDSSGDLLKSIAIERLSMKTDWKPSVDTFLDLPTIGNVDGDIRLVKDDGQLYRWVQTATEWQSVSSVFSLTVEEYDGEPTSSEINKLIFVQPEDNVYIADTTAYIGAPTPPGTLDNQSLVLSGSTLYNAGLSDSNINYKSGDPAGDIVAYSSNDSTFTLTTPAVSTNCNYGDVGTITAYLNGIALVTIDLGANFNETNRDGNQVIANYDITGTGDPVVNGVADFTGGNSGKGNLTVVSVGKYNNFKYFQKWVATLNITDASLLRQGYNEIYITHDGLTSYGGNQTSSKFDIFYDIDTGDNPSVTVPTIVEDTPVFKYLSGIKYYDTGSTFLVGAIVGDAFDNVYHSSNAPLVLSGWPGLTTTNIAFNNAAVSGVSNPPDIGETMTLTDWVLTQLSNQISINARITATPRDPYGSYTPQQSDSDNIMIFSYGQASTELIEHFRDEKYRLLNLAYDTIPSSIIDQWDSEESLDTYDDGAGLQIYSDELYFPTVDFSVNLPSGNPDYSGLASETNKIYLRAFKDTTASHANGTLRLTGLTKTQLYNRNIKVWIKAPSQTGWLDLTRDYNFATFTGIDDDGCWVDRDIQTNSDFKFTIGSFYTENSGDMIIVKILYPGQSAPHITYMSIIDW